MKEGTNGTHVGETRTGGSESVTCGQNGNQPNGNQGEVGTGGEGIETGGKVKVSGGRGEEGGAETPPLSAHRCNTSIQITSIYVSPVISIDIFFNCCTWF